MALKRTFMGASGPDPRGWMLTFSDLITLLLTFFVMLLCISSLDTKMVRACFSIAEGGGGVFDSAERGPATPIRRAAQELREAMLSGNLDDRDLKALLFPLPEQGASRIPLGGERNIEVEKGRRGVRIRLAESLLFDADRKELRPQALPILDRLGQLLSYSRCRISVEGYTDRAPDRPQSYGDAWEMSLGHTIEIVTYLIKVHRLSANRFRVGSFGASRPLAPNDTPENRNKNRRIELLLYENE